MEIVSVILSACVTMLALALFIISLGSYRKHGGSKLLTLCSVFFIFFIKGLVMSSAEFLDEFLFLQCSPYIIVLDLLMLVLLFVSTLKR